MTDDIRPFAIAQASIIDDCFAEIAAAYHRIVAYRSAIWTAPLY